MTCKWTIEDTIKGLEGMILSTKFIEHDFNGVVNIEACEQAIDLLKAQEPQKVKNIIGTAVSAIGDCPICGVQLHTAFIPGQIKTKFCYNCGKAVKWE